MNPWSVGFIGTLKEESNHTVLSHTVKLAVVDLFSHIQFSPLSGHIEGYVFLSLAGSQGHVASSSQWMANGITIVSSPG